jgi:MFS family permease
MADALGNSFLIIVLPLYIASGQIDLAGLAGSEVAGMVVGEEFLIGVVLSLFGLLSSLGQPITGRLSDRLGSRRRFVLLGLVVFGVASAAYPFVTSYWSILAVRMFQGLGAALTVPATVALVNEFAASDDERGGNFGVFNTFRLIGFGFGPIVAGVVIAAGPYTLPAMLSSLVPLGAAGGISLSGFNAAFGIAVFGAVVSFALVTVFIQDPPRKEMDDEADDLSIRILDPTGRTALDTVFVLGVGTFMMATTLAMFATLEAPIRARLDESTFLFSVQFAAAVIANVLFQVAIGRLSDRYGRRPFLLVGFAILIPSVFVQGFVTTPLQMLAARFLQGLAVAFVFAPALALAGDLAGAGKSGTTLSVLTMSFGLGVAFGPVVAGFLYNVGSYATPFVFGAALAVIALVLTYSQVEESSTGPAGPSGVAPTADD